MESKPSWAKLPFLVSAKLFEKMTCNSKTVARLVCKDWKYSVDHVTGVGIVIDESRDEEDFITFLKTIKLCQVIMGNVVALESQVQWKYPGALRKVICQGEIRRDWFCNLVLKQCTNLTRLVLKGDFLSKLIVNEGTDHPRPIVCPSLTSLEIVSPRGNTFPRPVAMSYYFNVFRDPNSTISPRSDFDCIQNTVYFLLRTIRSPKLSLLNVFVYENFLIHQQENYWKHHAFEEFLHDHRHSLKEIYLLDFRGRRSSQPSLISYMPKNLSHLEISIHRFYRTHGNAKVEQDQEFLRRLLSEQSKLTDLTVEFHKMRTFWISDVLTNVISNNKHTLKVIKLHIVCDEEDFFISGNLLSELECLEELKLEGDALTNNSLNLRDFAWLPKSLKKILTMFMRIEETDFSCIHEFKQLQYIELNHIVIENCNKEDDPELENDFSAAFTAILEQLLNHRKLDHLGLSLSKSIISDEKLKRLMDTIEDTANVLTPAHLKESPSYYGIVIAHRYEIDDKFDLYRFTDQEKLFSEDFNLQTRTKQDSVAMVEVRVEVELKDTTDYFEEQLTEDSFVALSDLSSDSYSDMPSLIPLHASSDSNDSIEDDFDISILNLQGEDIV